MLPGVRDKPTFKRDHKSAEKVPEHFSEIDQEQYDKFTRHRSEPLVEFGARKSQQDIDLRRIIVQRSRIPAEYNENKLFSTMFTDYIFNKREVGKNLSNVILSHLVSHRVKNPRIDFELSNCNSVQPLSIDKAMTKDEKEAILLSPETVAKNLETYRAFLKNWLDFTKIGEILQDFVARGNEFAPGFFPADKWVVRRMTLMQFNFFKEGPQKPPKFYRLGHELNLFWDIKRKQTGYVFHYGLIDSITIRNYKFHNDYNINFIEELENFVKGYLAQYVSLDEIGLNFKHIVSRFPSFKLDRPDIALINMQCTTKSFRHALYAAIFYNLKKLENPLETAVPFDLPLVDVVDQAPAQADPAPAEIDEPDQAPAQIDQAPAEPDQAPAEPDQAPAGTDQLPAESAPAPAGTDQAPAESVPAPAGTDQAPAEPDPELPKRQRLFQSQVTLYIHHMYRMRNWLATTPLLWPEDGQREPTKDRPVCSVTFGPEVTTATMEELFKRKGPHFHRLDKKVSRIILYNNFIHYPFTFWFHEEGEAFQVSAPETSPGEQCAISSRFLGMPVTGKTISKTKTKPARKTFLELAEEQDAFELDIMLITYPYLRPILKDIHLKSPEEVQARARLIAKFTPKNFRESAEFRAQFTKFNLASSIAAKGLSNVLMSYIAGGRVKTERIDMQLWTCNISNQLNLKKVNEEDPSKSLDEEKIEQLSEDITDFYTEWMISTNLIEIVKDCEKNGWRMNTKYFPRSKDVVRVMTPVSIAAKYSDGSSFSHQFLIFWQFRRISERYVLEYGVIDNIKDYDTGLILDHVEIFKTVFQQRMQSAVSYDDLVANMQVNFLDIKNKLPFTNVEREGIPSIEYTCVSATRRAIMYGCIFYDLSKISKQGGDALEDLTPFGIPGKKGHSDPLIDELEEASAAVAAVPTPADLTPAQNIFRNNINFYVHHMFRMLNWLTNSPLIWPAPGQDKPTSENPLCSITFGDLLKPYSSWEEFFLIEDSFFHRNDMTTSYIVLYDNWQKRERIFWFHEDGEVFRERRPEDYELVSCTISSRLDMPVMNKPSFKKPPRPSFEDVDTDQHDAYQYKQFYDLRKRSGVFVSDVIMKPDDEIDHRIEILNKGVVPLRYREFVDLWRTAFCGFEFDMWMSGTGLSEILFSYMLGNKVKNPHIKMEFSSLNTIDPMDLTKREFMNPQKRDIPVNIRQKTEYVNKFFQEWLAFTELDVLLQKYVNGGYKFNYVQFPRDVWVIRKMTYLDVALIFPEDDEDHFKSECHEMVVFWQVRRTSSGFALEYGFIDNVGERHYKGTPNIDFKRIFERQMHYFLSLHLPFEQLSDHMSMECISIWNNTPWNEHKRPGVPDINMTCTTCAKRALLYGAMFYDMSKISEEGDKALEDLTPFGLPESDPEDQTPQPLLRKIIRAALNFYHSIGGTSPEHRYYTPAQQMYRSNMNFYVHHMYRMMNWLATSPLIWPEPGQESSTAERPVCSISLGPYRQGIELTELLDKTSGTKFHKNTSCMAYIFLYDPVRKQPRKFWFHEEGEAFREEPPRTENVDSCSISARAAECSKNNPCSVSAQLKMPVRNSPQFKRDRSNDDFYSRSKDEDEIQFERFATLRPEIDNMVSGLRLKTEAEVQARSEIVNNEQLPIQDNVYIELYDWNQGFQNFILNSLVEGSGLSDVLMSYMLGCKIKNPLVKNTFSSINTFYPLYISNIRNSVTMETFKDSYVESLRDALKRFFREWLIFTSPGELLREFMLKGYSFPLSKFPRNCQVLRRVTVFDLNSVFNVADPSKRLLEGHEIVLFWQIRKKSQGYVFEYGVIDNLPVAEYEFDLGHTFNFHQIFQDEMRAYLSTFHDFSELCAQLKVEFMVITNSVPGAMVMIRNKISVNFLCKAIARRALMYCSIFYDIRKIASVGEEALERRVHVDFDHDFESMSFADRLRYFYGVVMTEPGRDSLSSSEEMFRSNVRFYVHHMFRMFNWLSTSPLIWPEPGQLTSTENRPVCQISFGENRLNKDYMDLFAQDSSFFHNNDRDMAYIVLYDSLKREARKFWFHEDGEAFREEPSRMEDIDSCSISAPFERLGMPVKKTTMFKPKTPQDFVQMTKDEDEIQYERFVRLRPEIESAVSMVLTKTSAEIDARDQICASLVVPEQYRENKESWNEHFHNSINNSYFIGSGLSDIMLSYMMSSIVRNPLIKMDFYGINNKQRFFVSKHYMEPEFTPVPEDGTQHWKRMLELFFLNWLDFTGPGELLHDYVRKERTFSITQFPRKVLVIRKTICISLVALFPRPAPVNFELEGHEILLYWQIRKTETGHVMEFGIIDNLPPSYYDIENERNQDFFKIFRDQMRVHLGKHVTMPELRAVDMHVLYRHIKNVVPMTRFHRNNQPLFCFQCTTAARRALLYLSIFYDITKLSSETDLLEGMTVFGLPVDTEKTSDSLILRLVNMARQVWGGAPQTSFTEQELLFRSNVNFYVHHMYRMMNWLATTPLIWPEQGQTAPTESHPMCQITFDAERQFDGDTFEAFLTGAGPHFHKKNMSKTFITLYDCFRQTPRIFWFHEDGEPFREERPCMDDKHRCSLQSDFFLGVKKKNKEKKETKSDALAIRDPPKFKRDWTERTVGDDNTQYKRFLESRPDITNFVENVVQKNILSVIYRMNLLRNMDIPEEYQESMLSHVCYAYTLINAQETGTFVSDILLSYLFYHRTSNERINFQAHQFNTDMHFDLGMKDASTGRPLPEEQVQVKRDLMSQKITEWLEFSRVRQYFENFLANGLKFSEYIFNEEILVIRRVFFNDILVVDNKTETGHEDMMYWEIRKLPEGSHYHYAFQYGFIDNLHEYSYFFGRDNINMFEMLKNSMESLLRSLPSSLQIMEKIQVSNVNIYAAHPMKEYSRKMSYTCMTSCRRTMLYASFFYDINKVGQRSPDKILEDMTDFGMPFSDCAKPSPFLQRLVGMAKDMYRALLRQPQVETAVVQYTPKQKMFRSNVNFYIHHLFRMYNWLVNSPLIWPSFLQMTPTADRPICAVTFGVDRCNIDPAEMFKRPGSHFHVLDRDHAKLILYDNFRKQPRTFWFHEEGEAFQEEMPEEGSVPKCVIQAKA